MTLGDVEVDDGGRGAVERDAAAGGVRRVAVDVAAVDDQIVRDLGERGLAAVEVDDGVDPGAHFVADFESDEAVVMSAGGGLDGGLGVGLTIFDMTFE